jgi:hypothetical protein
MKKILLLCSVALFLSCSDLSVSDEQAVKNELPVDFNRSDYAKINLDVPKSQIIFKVKENLGEIYNQPARTSECKKFLNPDGEISPLALDIYANYLGCPKAGWDANDKCSLNMGIYGQVPAYTKAVVKGKDTTWQCVIGGCWSGGLDELVNTDCRDAETSILSPLCNNENLVLPTTLLNTMCKFVLPEASDPQAAEEFLRDFPYDSTLIERHYLLVGRNEGRPYKYCNGEATDILRNPDLALKVGADKTIFYDYGQNLFCLNETDSLIYLLK